MPVDGGRWLVGGSLEVGSVGLYLIDTAAKSAKTVALSIAAEPDPVYVGCAAPNLKGLSTHGLDVVPGSGGLSTVYAVNHGGRDSIEVFHLNPGKATAQWIGCEVLPEGSTATPWRRCRGGRVRRHQVHRPPRDKQAFQKVLAGEINGVVLSMATPGKGFSAGARDLHPGDNGIVVSSHGKWLFVNSYGTHEYTTVSPSAAKASARVSKSISIPRSALGARRHHLRNRTVPEPQETSGAAWLGNREA